MFRKHQNEVWKYVFAEETKTVQDRTSATLKNNAIYACYDMYRQDMCICADNNKSISSCFRGALVPFLDTSPTVHSIQSQGVSPLGQVSEEDGKHPVIVYTHA